MQKKFQIPEEYDDGLPYEDMDADPEVSSLGSGRRYEKIKKKRGFDDQKRRFGRA